MNYNIDQFDVMMEAFYGKNPKFIECEKCIAELRAASKVAGKKYDKHPANIKLQNILNDVFGFKSTYIHWDISVMMTKSNFTLPTCVLVTGAQALTGKLKWNGKPYDDTHTMGCVMDISSTLFNVLNDSEILAIIIHEIGHNFEVNPYRIFQFIAQLASLFSMTKAIVESFTLENLSLILSNPFSNLRKLDADTVKDLFETTAVDILNDERFQMLLKLQSANNVIAGWSSIVGSLPPFKKLSVVMMNIWDILMQKIPGMSKISKAFGNLSLSFTRASNMIGPILSASLIPLAIAQIIIAAPSAQLITLGTFKGEKFADSIAASFGYGAPLSSALNKLDVYYRAPSEESIRKSSDFVKFLYNLGFSMQEFAASAISTHGTAFERTGNMLKSLKKDLDNLDFEPGAKAELQREIEVLESAYKRMMSKSGNDHISIAIGIRSFLYKHCNGNLKLIDQILPDLKVNKR